LGDGAVFVDAVDWHGIGVGELRRAVVCAVCAAVVDVDGGVSPIGDVHASEIITIVAATLFSLPVLLNG
jgi:hypothetical protein